VGISPSSHGHVGVQVPVVDVLDDLPADQLRQLLQVDHVARGRIDLACDHDLDDVLCPCRFAHLPNRRWLSSSDRPGSCSWCAALNDSRAADEHGRRAGHRIAAVDGRIRIAEILIRHFDLS